MLHSRSIITHRQQYFLRLLAVRGKIHNFLRLLAARFLTSCVSNVLAGKPQKHSISISCAGLGVLAVQELLAPLLVRALCLGSTVLSDVNNFQTQQLPHLLLFLHELVIECDIYSPCDIYSNTPYALIHQSNPPAQNFFSAPPPYQVYREFNMFIGLRG